MRIAIFGDIILDKYIVGTTSRISPEAPVPIVRKTKEYVTLGGAANVAYNISKLEKSIELYGAIGEDLAGLDVISLCKSENIKTQLYKTSIIPTTTKTRVISRNQQMLRIDDEKIMGEVDTAQLINMENMNSYGIIGISDYAKGYISSNLMKAIKQGKQTDCKIIIDPKGKEWEKYNGAFLIKPNISEVEDVLNITLGNNNEEVAKAADEIFEKFTFENILITRGEGGMTLKNKDGVKHYPTQKAEVFDVSGAGDTSLAVLICRLSEGVDLDVAIKHAIKASTYVVTKPMTYAISKQELDELVKVQ
jgi:rfaE bifunctional protein kinase chain/domain